MKNKLYILFVFLLCCSVLYAENIHLKVGDIRTLSPSVLSSKVLAGQPAWTSSRPYDVAISSSTMYSCEIEALRPFDGYAIIHCLYYYRELDPITGRYIYQRSGYVDYNVYVEEEKIVSIDISPTNIELIFGETRKMDVTVLPSNADQTVTWSSTDRSVASVNSDNILGANGYGTAVVTATTKNGLSASCSVKVKKKSDGGDGGDYNDGNDEGGAPDVSNFNTIDYYYQISKKRMDALRNKAIQQKNKLNEYE